MHTLSIASFISVPVKQVIYLGAGIGNELSTLLSLDAETIHLVEGDKEHQELLESEIVQFPQVRLVKKLVSDQSLETTFYRYSLSELNSLQKGSGLKDLFPNVRLLEQQSRQTESLVKWLSTLQLSQRNNLLWIDLPGQEAVIINHLIEHQFLDLFDSIMIYAHLQPCYEGQETIDQLNKMLADHGYVLQQQNTDIDPDRPLLVLKRHSLYWKHAELENELAETRLSGQVKSEKVQQLEKQLTESQQSANAKHQKVTALEAQLAEAHKTANANKDAVNKLNAEHEVLVQEKHSLSDKLNHLAKEKETLEINKAALEKTLTEKLTAAVQSSESKQATITQLQTELTETKQSAQAQAEKLQQLEKQLLETQQSAKAKQEKVTALEVQLAETQQTATANKDAVNKLNAEHEVLVKEKHSLIDKLNHLAKEKETLEINKAALEKTLTEKLTAAVQSSESKQATIAQLQTELAETKQAAQAQAEKIQLLETQLNAGKETQHGLSELQKQMEYLFNQNRLQLEQAANALGQHISHTGKQTAQELQTFVQCQQTLGKNTQALHYQDQSLPPEFALYLNQKLANGQYDVILVMGSGVLTQFIASQLQQGTQQQPRLSHQEASSDQSYVVPDQGDLPKRVLAFEHKKSDSKDLKKHLQQNGLQTWVNVGHAPLIECRFSGKDYLYYDLRKPLSRLADVYEERHAKMLILLSPNQASETITTEACLPAILQELSTHHLELLLHPNTDQFQSIKTVWQSLLESRDLDYSWVEDTNINIAQLTVNP